MSHLESLSNRPQDGDDDAWLYGNDGVDVNSTAMKAASAAVSAAAAGAQHSLSRSTHDAKLPSGSATLASAVGGGGESTRPSAAAKQSNLDDYGQPDDTFHDEEEMESSKKTAAVVEASNGDKSEEGLFLNEPCSPLGVDTSAKDDEKRLVEDATLPPNTAETAGEHQVSEAEPTNESAEDSGILVAEESLVVNGEDQEDAIDEDEDEDDDDDDDGFKVNIVLDNIVTKSFGGESEAQDRQQGKLSAITAAASAASAGANGGVAVKPTVKGIDLDAPGLINDVPTDEYNLAEIPEEQRPWRKPGADITDYFNYGFTEETWIAYCVKKRRQRVEGSNLGSKAQHLGQESAMIGLQNSSLSAGVDLASNGFGSGGLPLQPIQVSKNNTNGHGHHFGQRVGFQQQPPYLRVAPLQQQQQQQQRRGMLEQTNRRRPFGMYGEHGGEMSPHQTAQYAPPPPPPWTSGPPPSMMAAQQAGGMMPRMPPQQRMVGQNDYFSTSQAQYGQHHGHGSSSTSSSASSSSASYHSSYQQHAALMGAPGHQVNIPPPGHDGRMSFPPPPPPSGSGFGGFSQPPPMSAPGFRGRPVNNAGGLAPHQAAMQQHMMQQHRSTPGPSVPTWEKPPTIEQQSAYFDPGSLKSPTKQRRGSRSPSPGVQSPSQQQQQHNSNNRSPNSQSQHQQLSSSESSSSHRYQANKELDGKTSGSSSYKPRSGDYGRGSDRGEYDRDHHRRSPSSPRHRHARHHDRRDVYYRDRDRSRSRDRDRDRSRSREDRYKRRTTKMEDDDYYRSKQSSSSSSSSKRAKKPFRGDRDGSSDRTGLDVGKQATFDASPVFTTLNDSTTTH